MAAWNGALCDDFAKSPFPAQHTEAPNNPHPPHALNPKGKTTVLFVCAINSNNT